MSTDELLKLVRQLGMRVELRPDGSPTLKVPAALKDGPVVGPLVKVLRFHRPEILRRLGAAEGEGRGE